MKRKNVVAKRKPLSFPAGNGPSPSMPAANENTFMQAHQDLMSRGERIFSLRDVHPYWSTPQISPREVEELERENLIERSPHAICSIRLTPQGVLLKNAKPMNDS